LAELVAAHRPRLVRRKIGVEEDRHRRHRVLRVHDAAMHIGDGMPFAFAFRQRLRRGDVKARVHQRLDEMGRKPGVDRIVARPLILEEALPVLHVPFREAGAVVLVLLVAVADAVAVIDRERRPAVVLVAFVLIVAHHDQRVDFGFGQRLLQLLDGVAGDVLTGDEVLGRHHMGELGIGLLQEVAIGDLPSLLVAVLDLLVGLQETLERLVGCEQHGRVGCSQAEHDLGHRLLLELNRS
jgi:hypothetical protein